MRNQAKPFLRNAVILTIALVIVGLMMNSWGVVQILIMVLLAVLTAGQWSNRTRRARNAATCNLR